MARQTKFTTESDLRKLKKMLKVGDTVYEVLSLATNLAPWEDPYQYSEHTVTSWSWINQDWMLDSGTVSVGDLVHRRGAYLAPPKNMRDIAAPLPQVAGPLPAGQEFDRDLNESELAYLEGRVASAKRDQMKAGRGLKGHKSSWF